METVSTYFVTIHIGLREKYESKIHSIKEVYEICQEYIKENSTCVSVTKTHFFYKDGDEPGVRIEFMQYPRIPKSEDEIYNMAEKLGKIIMYKFNQYRFSISDKYGITTYENEKLLI